MMPYESIPIPLYTKEEQILRIGEKNEIMR